MKKVYYIGPIICFVLFAAYAANFNKQYDAHEEQKAIEDKLAKDQKLKAETDARKKAIDEAVAAQARLKEERLNREAEDLRKKEARQAAVDLRNSASREQEKIARQIENIKKEIKIEQDAIAKLEGSIKYYKDEKIFISQFTEKAQQNIAYLKELLAKAEAMEIARETPLVTKPNNQS